MNFNRINGDNWNYISLANKFKWNGIILSLIQKCKDINDANKNNKCII